MRALSYPGSTVLNVFAGSGMTARVAVETGRHSIAGDIDPQLHAFLALHLAQIETDTDAYPPYALLGEKDVPRHPVFARAQAEKRHARANPAQACPASSRV